MIETKIQLLKLAIDSGASAAMAVARAAEFERYASVPKSASPCASEASRAIVKTAQTENENQA